MNTLSIHNSVQTIANIGVVLGLIFLGTEIYQNNTLNRANAVNSLFVSGLDFNDNLASNSELADVLAKANRGEPLNDSETIQLGGFQGGALQRIWFDYQQIRNGLVSEEELLSRVPRFKLAFSRFPFLEDRWNDSRSNFAPEFNQFIERCVLADCNAIPE